MTNEEFGQWLEHHMANFPGLKKWLGENRKTIERWQQAFEGITLSSAKDASDEMFRDEDTPASYQKHVPIVLRLCRKSGTMSEADEQDQKYYQNIGRSRARRWEGSSWQAVLKKAQHPEWDVNFEETSEEPERYECSQCQDEGLIPVINQKTRQFVREGRGPLPILTAVTRCPCKAGDSRSKTGVPLFDPERYIRYDPLMTPEIVRERVLMQIG